jgi:hypothetical protein
MFKNVGEISEFQIADDAAESRLRWNLRVSMTPLSRWKLNFVNDLVPWLSSVIDIAEMKLSGVIDIVESTLSSVNDTAE